MVGASSMEKVVCNCCGKEKSPFEFYNRMDGSINKICKDCKKIQSAARYRKSHLNAKTYQTRGEEMIPLKSEKWRNIIYKQKVYYVSNFGRIAYKRSDNRFYLYKQQIDKKGYVRIGNKSVFAHRLVVTAFISEIPDDKVINHKNGIKTDNRVENLEIVTQKVNVIHAINVLGKFHVGLNGRFGKDHPLSKPVLCYDKNGVFVKRYESICEASRDTKMTVANISAVCCKRPHCKTCGGYVWEFE